MNQTLQAIHQYLIQQGIDADLRENNGINHNIDPQGTMIIVRDFVTNYIRISINIKKSEITLTMYTPMSQTAKYNSQKHWDLANPQLLQELTQSITQFAAQP